MARIGLLTGGGDCPGLNPVIRAIVRKGIQHYGHEIFGFRKGWKGVLENDAIELTRENTSGILHKGGTILGTSRTNVYKTENGEQRVLASLKERGIDVLIPIGGDDTLGVARKLFAAGFPTVGVPKTIDNDLNATDFTFGFQTAVQIATEAIDRLHSTAESHDRVIVCEVMGRDAGWIACYSGIAGGADVILVPERPFDVDEVCEHITPPPRDDRQDVLDRRRRRGRDAGRRRRRGDRGRHGRLVRPCPPRRDRPPARAADRGARPATSAARRCSATSSAAARRSHSTASSAPASASRRSTRPPTATSARWSRCTAPRSSSSRSRTR